MVKADNWELVSIIFNSTSDPELQGLQKNDVFSKEMGTPEGWRMVPQVETDRGI